MNRTDRNVALAARVRHAASVVAVRRILAKVPGGTWRDTAEELALRDAWEYPHASDCGVFVSERCDCVQGVDPDLLIDEMERMRGQ